MRYKVQNNTSYSDTPKTFWISVDDGTNSFPIKPGDISFVSDENYDIIVANYAPYFTLFGPDLDPKAPVQLQPVLTTSWQLLDLTRYCTQIQVYTAIDCEVSFSGWSGAPTGNPPTQYIIDVPASSATPGSSAWTFQDQMVPFKQFFARSTTGTVTPTIIAS